ncbi:MAG: LysR family transcriptional regulator [Rhodobacteraceae bacterium]|nr:LysR family transcriptional regulator [Paracoccaceae bacterium]
MFKGVTLRGLEVFEALAAFGSVAQAAEVTGMSQPAVSQQLRNLEAALGVDLVDHSRRPMRLTPAGRAFLARAEAALGALRQGLGELSVMDLSHLDTLSIGLIDDFDNDLTPRLVTELAESLVNSRFKMITAPSLQIVEEVQSGALQVAITALGETRPDGVITLPLARDPFVIVAPRGVVTDAASALDAVVALPLLRYTPDQLIGQQVETVLDRLGLNFETRVEVGSHLALMAMVARRNGWAITTPLGYMRAARFHDQIDCHPLPTGAGARDIALLAGADWSEDVPRDLAATVRRLLADQTVKPALDRLPWLSGELRLLDL